MLNSILGNKPQSYLDIAEKAIKKGNYSKLNDAANAIKSQLHKHSYLVEPLIVIAQHLSKNKKFLPNSISAFCDAANHSPIGSALKQQAVAGLKECEASNPRMPNRKEASSFIKKMFQNG